MSDILLIVFTDEVGSTRRDCSARTSAAILTPRLNLFSAQLDRLQDAGWRVLKNVGDSLVIRCDCNVSYIADAIYSLFLAWRDRLPSSTERLRVAISTMLLSSTVVSGHSFGRIPSHGQLEE
jgi:hypothetical protein